MPQICDMGQRLYFPSEGRRAEDFFVLKNPTASAGFEPANLGIKGQHATFRPPKLLACNVNEQRHLWPARLYRTYFSTLSHERHGFWKKLLNIKRVFDFIYVCSKHFSF